MKSISNVYQHKLSKLDIPRQVLDYSCLKETNIGDTVFVKSDLRSHEQGIVTGVTLKGVHLYSLNKEYLFVKWYNVQKIIKEVNE